MDFCSRRQTELAGPVFTNPKNPEPAFEPLILGFGEPVSQPKPFKATDVAKKVWLTLVPASWTPKLKGIVGQAAASKTSLKVARAHEQPAVWVPQEAPVQQASTVEEVTPVGPSPVTTSRSGQTDDELAHHGEVVEAPVQEAAEEVTPVGPSPVKVFDRVVEVPQVAEATEEVEPDQAEPGRGRQVLKRGAEVLAVGVGAAATAVVAHKALEYSKDHKGVLSTGASILKDRVKYRILHMGEKSGAVSGLRVKAQHVAKALGGGLLSRLARR